MLLVVASLTDDSRGIIDGCTMFMVQATRSSAMKQFPKLFCINTRNSSLSKFTVQFTLGINLCKEWYFYFTLIFSIKIWNFENLLLWVEDSTLQSKFTQKNFYRTVPKCHPCKTFLLLTLLPSKLVHCWWKTIVGKAETYPSEWCYAMFTER